jgi:hypothetical protein
MSYNAHISGLSCPVYSSEVRIEGLETLDYLDNLSQRERHTEQGDAITFESEVNITSTMMYASILQSIDTSSNSSFQCQVFHFTLVIVELYLPTVD